MQPGTYPAPTPAQAPQPQYAPQPYPQPAPGYPQGYPQPAPQQQYAPAPGYPQQGIPAAYPQPQTYYAQQPVNPAYAQAPATGDQFGAPPATGGARPTIKKIGPGRLVLLFPIKIEKGVVSTRFKNPDGTPTVSDRMTADVVVLDGPPVTYGGDDAKMIPDTLSAPTGPDSDKHMGVYINGKILISQCERTLDPNGQRSILGRLIQVPTAGTPGWKLDDPTEADKALAREWFAKHPRQDQFSAPAPAVAQHPAVQAPQAPVQQYIAPAPQVGPSYPVQPQQAPQQQYAPPPAPMPQPPAPAAQIPCPPAIDPAWFYAQPIEAQQYYASQAAATAPPAAPQPGAPGPWA